MTQKLVNIGAEPYAQLLLELYGKLIVHLRKVSSINEIILVVLTTLAGLFSSPIFLLVYLAQSGFNLNIKNDPLTAFDGASLDDSTPSSPPQSPRG